MKKKIENNDPCHGCIYKDGDRCRITSFKIDESMLRLCNISGLKLLKWNRDKTFRKKIPRAKPAE